MRRSLALLGLSLLLAPAFASDTAPVAGDSPSLDRWVSEEFVPSTLSKAEKRAELTWLAEAAAPLRGLTIKVISENFPAHRYEANTLTRAFEEITGIRVIHEITDEDDLVRKIQAQTKYAIPLYDAYVNDSDMLGTHFRSDHTLPVSELIAGIGAAFTSPTLDLADLLGTELSTTPDGTLYQLPDLLTLNIYWYRHDWFTDPDLKQRFRQRYGYDLGIPLNWAAYEDIADFFSRRVGTLDGQRIYGHFDYGKEGPPLGWRFSDAWLSIAGTGDPGLPNGVPVDEWGIRAESCHPVGASMTRGGALDSPAAIHAIETYIRWLADYAPPDSRRLDFADLVGQPLRADIAQQIFWYIVFLPETFSPQSYLTAPNGESRWRVAPTPTGPYWQEGMKIGYRDTGAWTFLRGTPEPRLQAAWLYAQFVVSRSVSLRKTLFGFTPIRRSDLASEYLSAMAPRLGGLVEFARSRLLERWSSTGLNVPDYPTLTSLWWRHLDSAIKGREPVPDALRNLAEAFDSHLAELEKSGTFKRCAPRLNPATHAEHWLSAPGAPKPAIDTRAVRGRTVPPEQAREYWGY